jgi:hypothetical protein
MKNVECRMSMSNLDSIEDVLWRTRHSPFAIRHSPPFGLDRRMPPILSSGPGFAWQGGWNMRWLQGCVVAVLGVALVGCGKAPKLAMHTGSDGRSARTTDVDSAVGGAARTQHKPREKSKYHGWTAEQWARALESSESESILRACQALHILSAEGRPYLFRGLESDNPETRRLCLESLSVSELRSFGEDGKQMLIKLAGDRSDIRIRERATLYITQWNQATPAP